MLSITWKLKLDSTTYHDINLNGKKGLTSNRILSDQRGNNNNNNK